MAGEIGGLSILFWVSWLGVLVAGVLAYFGFTQNRQSTGSSTCRDERLDHTLAFGR
jgi:hypothetical protein